MHIRTPLPGDADSAAAVIQDLAVPVEGLLLEHGKAVIERQFVQLRLARAARCAWMFIPAAILGRGRRKLGNDLTRVISGRALFINCDTDSHFYGSLFG